MEALEEEQECEEGNKARREVISEHSECQTGLGDRVPRTLDQMLKVKETATKKQYKVMSKSCIKDKKWQEIWTDIYLHFCCPKLSKKDLSHELSQQKHQHKGLYVQHLKHKPEQA